jgi:hypothetical protein
MDVIENLLKSSAYFHPTPLSKSMKTILKEQQMGGWRVGEF